MKNSLLLSLLLLFAAGCLADISQQYGQQRYHKCRLDRLEPIEPSHRVQAEGGVIESWDPNHEQLQCAGVAVQRYIIEPNGLLLPQYTNVPRLIYIERGRGIKGVVIPGCPETYQESQQSEFPDQHQKIRHVRARELFAVPAGATHWTFNDGNERLVATVLLDVSNNANQLDSHPREFYLAGNPEEEFQRPRSNPEERGRGEHGNKHNIFHAFDDRTLAQILDIKVETARKLRGEDDQRRNIIKVEGPLRVIRPPRSRGGEQQDQEGEEEREAEREYQRPGRYSDNGLDETICSLRLAENIGDASRADIYTAGAGRLSTTNSLRFPVLRWLQLSAEYGVLYRNAMYMPHWNQNAHSIIFVTGGRGFIQVVDDRGQTIFDGEVRPRQILVVPQNFVVVKKAAEEGLEWVAFKTNDQASVTPLAGRNSALRALPVQVIASAYRISTEEAQRLKYNNRDDGYLVPPREFRSAGQRGVM